jgi:hypothetical protein
LLTAIFYNPGKCIQIDVAAAGAAYIAALDLEPEQGQLFQNMAQCGNGLRRTASVFGDQLTPFAVLVDDVLLIVPDIAVVERAQVVDFSENGFFDVFFQQQVNLIADKFAELFGRVGRFFLIQPVREYGSGKQ